MRVKGMHFYGISSLIFHLPNYCPGTFLRWEKLENTIFQFPLGILISQTTEKNTLHFLEKLEKIWKFLNLSFYITSLYTYHLKFYFFAYQNSTFYQHWNGDALSNFCNLELGMTISTTLTFGVGNICMNDFEEKFNNNK